MSRRACWRASRSATRACWRRPSMLNILGDVWFDGERRREPDWASVLAVPGRQAAPVRQERGATWPQDGPRDCVRRQRCRSAWPAPHRSRGVLGMTAAVALTRLMESRPIDPDAIARAVVVLKRGGLVAMPTETVYGLAADAGNEAAVRAIFAAKGRPAGSSGHRAHSGCRRRCTDGRSMFRPPPTHWPRHSGPAR